MSNSYYFPDRGVLRLTGRDVALVLQGLISNDITKLTNDGILYALLLNAKGRFLFDVFLYKKQDEVFLDCNIDQVDALISYVLEYKFRRQITIERIDNLVVTPHGLMDPRHQGLGGRDLIPKTPELITLYDDYHLSRIKLGIVDGVMDLIPNVSLPLDYGLHNLNAISFNKGCYCGQEAISKAWNIVGVRRGIFIIKGDLLPKKGEVLSTPDLILGKMGSSIYGYGLCCGEFSVLEPLIGSTINAMGVDITVLARGSF